jgi:hypothetical protein
MVTSLAIDIYVIAVKTDDGNQNIYFGVYV